jgi:hypothetical protein
MLTRKGSTNNSILEIQRIAKMLSLKKIKNFSFQIFFKKIGSFQKKTKNFSFQKFFSKKFDSFQKKTKNFSFQKIFLKNF